MTDDPTDDPQVIADITICVLESAVRSLMDMPDKTNIDAMRLEDLSGMIFTLSDEIWKANDRKARASHSQPRTLQ